jgi:hypothetical protein
VMQYTSKYFVLPYVDNSVKVMPNSPVTPIIVFIILLRINYWVDEEQLSGDD